LYSLETAHGNLYALNPNQGDLDRITPQGQISRVLDTSAVYGHIVPTALAYHGNFYIGNLGIFPPTQGSQSIYKVTPGGQSKVVVKGLTMITGMTFDNRNRLYVLQNTAPVSDEDEIFDEGTGVVVRVNPSGTIETIATGLSSPAGVTFGPDGALYVSNFGFGFTKALDPKRGQIVRISIPKHRNMQSNEQDDDGHEDDPER
jgi:sugar lactone lactonase YvrE